MEARWCREGESFPVPFSMSDAADRVVVTWDGPGEPIVLALCGPDGEVAAVPLLPKRALTLAKELLDCGVLAIKVDWPG